MKSKDNQKFLINQEYSIIKFQNISNHLYLRYENINIY